ncbi:MAG TPA: hypothetical protein DCY79_16315 [Planctomycetaceae bacterium]|nr:hypothetical protein [Blastopirellula sp.]MAR11163.1 hypothetical protein [Blastopirellula sp.]HAY81370.1 hypothetical protein [Planctomycetaceae bacterium]|tara:strand:+ start:225 stop:581 length:357 start_codon:yes stop_codon:yes gene_type:complete
MSNFKHFDEETQQGVTVVRIKDHEFLDRLIGGELQEELISYVKQTAPKKLVVSFERVQRFSSETINALIRAREYVVSDGGSMKLCEMRPEIRNVFRILNLEDNVFEIHDSTFQAIDTF